MLFPKARHILATFRCSAHNLMIEQGRFINVERSYRICQFCNMNCIEDEYHFLLVCPVYRDLRQKYLRKYYSTWALINEFKLLLTSKSEDNVIILYFLLTYIYVCIYYNSMI